MLAVRRFSQNMDPSSPSKGGRPELVSRCLCKKHVSFPVCASSFGCPYTTSQTGVVFARNNNIKTTQTKTKPTQDKPFKANPSKQSRKSHGRTAPRKNRNKEDYSRMKKIPSRKAGVLGPNLLPIHSHVQLATNTTRIKMDQKRYPKNNEPLGQIPCSYHKSWSKSRGLWTAPR